MTNRDTTSASPAGEVPLYSGADRSTKTRPLLRLESALALRQGVARVTCGARLSPTILVVCTFNSCSRCRNSIPEVWCAHAPPG
jgi:hypothetical protein